MTFPMGDTEDYRRELEESDGFDINGMISASGLRAFYCEGEFCKHPYLALVKLYARAGLHRYNMLMGTKLELDRLKKFNVRMQCASGYYITLLAYDPASCLPVTFQVHVDETCFGRLDFACFVARPKPLVSTKEPFIHPDDKTWDYIYRVSLPEWPSDNAFNDRKRFYVVKESDFQNIDWIYLYLELVVCAHDRRMPDSDLSKLKISKVAIETIEDVEPPNERLNAKRAVVYITFKGLAIGGTGEHVERKAIVRRVITEGTGYLSLKGDLWSGEKALNSELRSMTLQSGEGESL